jgi:integrase
MLRSLLTWAHRDAGLFDDAERFDNPFSIVAARDDRSQEEKRTSFSIADLATIFRLESITSPKRLEDRWVPLLALYTGARLEEIGQLLVSDVHREGNISLIHLNEFDEHGAKKKRLKTVGSRRLIPVHPLLIDLGFDTYVVEARQRGDIRLFPGLTEGAKGKLTSAFSKRINRQIRSMIPDRRKTFHSLRHSFKAASQRAMVPEDVVEALMGHSSRSVSREVYGAALGTLTNVLFDAIKRIEYPGLDLSHLKASR